MARTILERAAADEDTTKLKQNVNRPEFVGKTPLMISAKYSHHDLLKIAFDHGVEWSPISNDG